MVSKNKNIPKKKIRLIKLQISVILEKNNNLSLIISNIDARIINSNYRFFELYEKYYSVKYKYNIFHKNRMYSNTIIEQSLIFPDYNNNKRKIKIVFDTDKERKKYLRKLYNVLIEWSTVYYKFKNDKGCKFEVIDNIWKFTYLK